MLLSLTANKSLCSQNGISLLHQVWHKAVDHKEIRVCRTLSAHICCSQTPGWSPAMPVRNINTLFPPCLKWMRYLATFKTEGAEWKELTAKSVECQRHSVLLEILPGNRDQLNFSWKHCWKTHGTKGSACRKVGGVKNENSRACAWLSSSATLFCSVEPVLKKTSRSAEMVRADVEDDWTGQTDYDEILLVRRA